MTEKTRPNLLKRIMRGTLAAKLGVFGPPLIILAIGFAVAGKFIQPAPPDTLTIASGGTSGAYYAFAQKYKKVLAREGVELKIESTSGSVQNLEMLRAGKVDAAFVQSGIGKPREDEPVFSLGSLYFEPLWVFHRADTELELLSDLKGRRVAIGGVGSGTRTFVEPILTRNGITRQNTKILDSGGKPSAEALRRGDVDAAFYIASAESPVIRELVEDRSLELMTFQRAEAYTRHYLYMSKVILPRGMVNFEQDVPAKDKTLLAAAATLVIHDDLHPALRTLLLRAMTEIHGPGGLFERPQQFPSMKYLDFPLTAKAKRYIEDGPSLLDRYLPYWVADMLVRLSILLLPLVTLLIPLMRIVPPLYKWRMRSRIIRWYKEMVIVETQVRNAETAEQREAAFDRLEEIDEDVSQVSVPVGYRDMHYTLRFHIDLMRNMLHRKADEAEEAAAEEAGESASKA
jgi:uncharacterized protein